MMALLSRTVGRWLVFLLFGLVLVAPTGCQNANPGALLLGPGNQGINPLSPTNDPLPQPSGSEDPEQLPVIPLAPPVAGPGSDGHIPPSPQPAPPIMFLQLQATGVYFKSSGTFLVQGSVTDDQGKPFAGAEVTFTDTQSGATAQTNTQVDGSFSNSLPTQPGEEVVVKAKDLVSGLVSNEVHLLVGDHLFVEMKSELGFNPFGDDRQPELVGIHLDDAVQGNSSTYSLEVNEPDSGLALAILTLESPAGERHTFQAEFEPFQTPLAIKVPIPTDAPLQDYKFYSLYLADFANNSKTYYSFDLSPFQSPSENHKFFLRKITTSPHSAITATGEPMTLRVETTLDSYWSGKIVAQFRNLQTGRNLIFRNDAGAETSLLPLHSVNGRTSEGKLPLDRLEIPGGDYYLSSLSLIDETGIVHSITTQTNQTHLENPLLLDFPIERSYGRIVPTTFDIRPYGFTITPTPGAESDNPKMELYTVSVSSHQVKGGDKLFIQAALKTAPELRHSVMAAFTNPIDHQPHWVPLSLFKASPPSQASLYRGTLIIPKDWTPGTYFMTYVKAYREDGSWLEVYTASPKRMALRDHELKDPLSVHLNPVLFDTTQTMRASPVNLHHVTFVLQGGDGAIASLAQLTVTPQTLPADTGSDYCTPVVLEATLTNADATVPMIDTVFQRRDRLGKSYFIRLFSDNPTGHFRGTECIPHEALPGHYELTRMFYGDTGGHTSFFALPFQEKGTPFNRIQFNTGTSSSAPASFDVPGSDTEEIAKVPQIKSITLSTHKVNLSQEGAEVLVTVNLEPVDFNLERGLLSFFHTEQDTSPLSCHLNPSSQPGSFACLLRIPNQTPPGNYVLGSVILSSQERRLKAVFLQTRKNHREIFSAPLLDREPIEYDSLRGYTDNSYDIRKQTIEVTEGVHMDKPTLPEITAVNLSDPVYQIPNEEMLKNKVMIIPITKIAYHPFKNGYEVKCRDDGFMEDTFENRAFETSFQEDVFIKMADGFAPQEVYFALTNTLQEDEVLFRKAVYDPALDAYTYSFKQDPWLRLWDGAYRLTSLFLRDPGHNTYSYLQSPEGKWEAWFNRQPLSSASLTTFSDQQFAGRCGDWNKPVSVGGMPATTPGESFQGSSHFGPSSQYIEIVPITQEGTPRTVIGFPETITQSNYDSLSPLLIRITNLSNGYTQTTPVNIDGGFQVALPPDQVKTGDILEIGPDIDPTVRMQLEVLPPVENYGLVSQEQTVIGSDQARLKLYETSKLPGNDPSGTSTNVGRYGGYAVMNKRPDIDLKIPAGDLKGPIVEWHWARGGYKIAGNRTGTVSFRFAGSPPNDLIIVKLDEQGNILMSEPQPDISTNAVQKATGGWDIFYNVSMDLPNSEMGIFAVLDGAADSDGDGVPNKQDAFIQDPAIQQDVDGDGIDDDEDSDNDNDTVANAADNCPLVANQDQKDADGDGLGDACDGDIDQDGIPNQSDNCLAIANADQLDLDKDKIGDACDNDIDNDGIANASDNCKTVFNKLQLDLDGDTLGDACDPDDDNDGLSDEVDPKPWLINEAQDPDHDGLPTSYELLYGSDPINPNTDGDLWNDGEEVGTNSEAPRDVDHNGKADLVDWGYLVGTPDQKSPLAGVEDIAVSEDGTIFLTYPIDHSVLIYKQENGAVHYVGTYFCKQPVQKKWTIYWEPGSIAVDKGGFVYIVDTPNSQIRILSLQNDSLTLVSSASFPDMKFIEDLEAGQDGLVYASGMGKDGKRHILNLQPNAETLGIVSDFPKTYVGFEAMNSFDLAVDPQGALLLLGSNGYLFVKETPEQVWDFFDNLYNDMEGGVNHQIGATKFYQGHLFAVDEWTEKEIYIFQAPSDWGGYDQMTLHRSFGGPGTNFGEFAGPSYSAEPHAIEVANDKLYILDKYRLQIFSLPPDESEGLP